MSEPKESSVLEIITAGLAKEGLKPNVFGRFARIQAFWRGSKDFNISVNLKKGIWSDFVTGETGKPFNELVDLLGVDISNLNVIKESSSNTVELGGLQRKRSAKNLWEKGTPLNEDGKAHVQIARKYLESRGIPLDAIEKVLPKIKCVKKDDGGAILLFPIYSPIGKHEWIGIQRINLDANGNKFGEDPKMMLGSHLVGNFAGGFLISGDETRFQKKMLAICEGPETGLAIRAATGMPVYILFNSGGIAKVSIDFLSELGVTDVLIASDNDDPNPMIKNVQVGQKASFDLAERISKESNSPVRISIPPREYGNSKKSDWLDVLEKNPVGMAKLLFSSVEYVPEHLRTSNKSNVKINNVFRKKF